MKRAFFYALERILFWGLVPYICVWGMQGKETVVSKRYLEMEDLVAYSLMYQIPKEYEWEMVKAQAVIARTNLYKEGRTVEVCVEEGDVILEEIPDKVYRDAVRETEGLVMFFGKELEYLPYHERSNGRTRDGKEVFREEQYAYLKSVESLVDKEQDCENVYVKKEDFPEELVIEERDCAGYVMGLQSEEQIFEGMAFSIGFGLPSSDFVLEEQGDWICVQCRGRGHGLGMSQYGGNEMAKEGKDFEEILSWYFPEGSLLRLSSSRRLRRLGAGFGSALADIIPYRIPAHPRGALSRLEIVLPPRRVCYNSPPIGRR